MHDRDKRRFWWREQSHIQMRPAIGGLTKFVGFCPQSGQDTVRTTARQEWLRTRSKSDVVSSCTDPRMAARIPHLLDHFSRRSANSGHLNKECHRKGSCPHRAKRQNRMLRKTTSPIHEDIKASIKGSAHTWPTMAHSAGQCAFWWERWSVCGRDEGGMKRSERRRR